MNKNRPDIERIDNYLFDLMDAEARQAFEKEIENDEALAEAVAIQKIEHRTMQLLVQKDIKSNMQDWKKEKFAAQKESKETEAKVVSMTEQTKGRKRFFQLAAAAVVTLLFGAFFASEWAEQNYDGANLAIKDFSTSVENARTNNPDAEFPNIFQPAISAMLNKDYPNAIDLLENINNQAFQETANILQSECYFKMSEYRKTIEICENITENSSDDSNIEKAEWYLVLAYLASNEDKKAMMLMDKILANENHAYFPYAIKLKKDLDSFWGRMAN